jgi:hypothetical protein
MKYKNKYVSLLSLLSYNDKIHNSITYIPNIIFDENFNSQNNNEDFKTTKKLTDMNYKNRLLIYNNLHEKINNKDDCSGKNEFLGKGGHSIIYKKKIPHSDIPVEISIKEQKVNDMIISNKFNNKFKIWLEYDILKKSTDLILNGITQNLPMIYDLYICNDNSKLLFYNELADGSFLDWCLEEHTDDEWKSFIFQFWVGVYTLQKYLKLVHNDLRLGNVLFHKIKKTDEYWKYTIDDIEYYIPNEGYVFVIWDFGSSNLIDIQPINKTKLDLNIDLHFFHDLFNRLRVLYLLDNFSISELETFFTSDKDLQYTKEKKSECSKRFGHTRYEEKYKIALIYYLIENNKFDELKSKYISNKKNKSIKLPSGNIMKLLKELSDNNYNYDDVIKIISNPKSNIRGNKKIVSPNKLIQKYFSEYREKKNYSLKFNI